MYMNKVRGRRRVFADEEVVVAPEATDLLFEAEDVAEIVAEVSGQPVEVEAEGEAVTLTVGDGEEAEVYTIEAEGDEEVLESVRKPLAGKRRVAATRKAAPRKAVRASRTVRKVPKSARR